MFNLDIYFKVLIKILIIILKSLIKTVLFYLIKISDLFFEFWCNNNLIIINIKKL